MDKSLGLLVMNKQRILSAYKSKHHSTKYQDMTAGVWEQSVKLTYQRLMSISHHSAAIRILVWIRCTCLQKNRNPFQCYVRMISSNIQCLLSTYESVSTTSSKNNKLFIWKEQELTIEWLTSSNCGDWERPSCVLVILDTTLWRFW